MTELEEAAMQQTKIDALKVMMEQNKQMIELLQKILEELEKSNNLKMRSYQT